MGVITLEEYLKKQKKKDSNGIMSLEEFAEREGVDLTPKKSTRSPITTTTTSKDDDEEDRKWFQKGAFEDGYQRGDVVRAVLGTVTDTVHEVTEGVLEIGENVVDAGAYVVGGVGGLFGADDFKDNMQDFIEKDLYDSEKLVKKAAHNSAASTLLLLMGTDEEESSVLGEKSESLANSAGQLAGTVGLQAVGVPWWVTTGTTSFGGEVENAFNKGATYGQAGASGVITAGADILTEKISGGISFGGKTLDTVLDPALKKVGNNALRTGLKVGTDMFGEAGEEVLAGMISNAGSTLYKDEGFGEVVFGKEARQEYLESAIGGAVLGGGSSGVKAVQSTRNGVDYVTGRTKSEQSLVDTLVNEKVSEATKQKAIETEVEKAIAEREKAQGGQLTEKNKEALRNSIMQKIESGEIDISSTTLDKKALSKIEAEVEKGLENGDYELSKLESILTSEKTAQIEQLEQKLEATKDQTQKAEIQKQISELKTAKYTELKDMLKDNKYLVKSSYEAKMSGESYRYTEDPNEGEYAKAVRESAKTHLSNNTYSRKYVDAMAKLSEDTKRNYRFVNNKELAEQGDLVTKNNLTAEQKAELKALESRLNSTTNATQKADIQRQIDVLKFLDVGGVVKTDANGVETVLINVDSKQAPYRVLVHETKHVLERNALNEEFNKLLFDYAKKTGDYDTFREQIKSLYDTTDEAKITKELSAELSAYYFSNDTKFLESIVSDKKAKGILQKIKEVIDDLVIRFKGTEQQKQYRELQKTFEKLLKQAPTESKAEGKQQSISDSFYSRLDSWDGKTVGFSFIVGETSEALQKAGIPKKQIRWDASKVVKLLNKHSGMSIDVVKKIPELLENPVIVIDSKKNDLESENGSDSKIVMGELRDENKKLVTAVLLLTPTSKKGNRLDLIKISSAEGRSHIKSLFTKEDGTPVPIRYVDEKRIQSWLDVNRLQLPLHNLDLDSTEKVSQKPENVNKQFSLSDSNNDARKDVYGFKVREDAKVNEDLLEELSIHDPNAEVDADGNVTVYHRTSVENANEIKRTGVMKAQEDALFFSSKDSGYATDYGDTVVKLKIPSTVLEVNDIFDGEVHFDIPLKYKNGGFQLDVSKYLTETDTRYSLSDTDSKGRKLTPKQQEYLKDVTPELKDENGNIKVMYHGTANVFTVFNPFLEGGKNGTAEGYGIYFADTPEVSDAYGGKLMEGYLKVTHPATSDKKTIKKNDLVKLIKATAEAEAQRSVDDGDYDNVNDALRDTWVSNYVYTYDKPIDASYREVADSILSMNDNDMDIVQEVMGGLAIRNYDQAYRFYDILKGTLGVDGFITEWESDLLKGGKAQIVVAFDSNQFKSVTNENPTDNPDINMSLSNDIAPAKMLQDLRVGGRDIAPIREDVATEHIRESTKMVDDFAPLTEEQANERDEQQSDRLFSLNENDMPDEVDAPIYEDVEPADPFEGRDIKDVGKRNVKAYMYENPEVKPFFQQEARIMLTELNETIKGERVVDADLLYHSGGEFGAYGTTRFTSDDIAYLRDSLNMSYADIEKGLKAIIEDHGAENNAVSKRIEFLLNDRLGKGYTSFPDGFDIPADENYLNTLVEKQITEYSDEAKQRYFESLAETYVNDIGPIREDIAPIRQYEAIEPAPDLNAQEQEWANNKMVRAKDPNRVQASNTDAKMRRWVETSTESEVVDRKILPEDLDLSKIVYEPIPNKVTLNKANAKLDTLGYDDALTYFNSQLAGKKTSLEDIALGERLLQEAMKKGDHATAGELIQNISILGTELGQKVQALSIIQRLTPEGQLKMLYKTVRRGKVKGDKAFEGVELTQEMINHILKTYKADGTYDQNELNKAVEDVKKDLAKSMKVSGIDKVNAYRYLSMLGNPKTHIRNIVSNIAMKGTVAVKNAVARTVEDIAPIKDKTKTWKRATDEVKAFADKTTLEMKDVISEDTKYSEEASLKSKRDMFKNQILNKLYNFNNDLMAKEDWWFSKSAYKNALSEFLTANGIKTNEDIAKNKKIVEKAKAYALEQSQIATFRQYSWLANKIREVESKNVATEIAVGSILPFKKTPINIAKAGLSYSPIGLFVKAPYEFLQMKQGKKQASEVVDTLAQGVTGTTLTIVGYMLAMSGVLNGGGDDDKEGSYDYQLGKQTYSINVGGNSYSLSWLSPVAMPLFIGANAYEQLVEGEEWNGDVVMETLAQTLDPLSEMSFLSSLDSVLSSYDSGVEKFAGIGKSMLQNYATQFIPTLSSQVASTLDDTKRTTKVAGDSGFEFVDETINKLVYKIPFLRETLEPSTDIWGNEVKQRDTLIGRALENFIAPWSRKSDISTNIDEEIKDLYAQTGDNGIIPSVPYNYVNYNGEKYEMSAKEYTEYKKTYGQTAYDLLEELLETTMYKNATSEDKAEMVNDVYEYARDEAKREYLEKEGVTYTNATKDGNEYYKENPIKGAIENDMMIEEFDFYSKYPEKYALLQENGISYKDYTASEESREAYNWALNNPKNFTLAKAVTNDVVKYKQYTSELSKLTADKDANGKTISNSRKEKVVNYINNLDIDYGAKLILFKSVYNADDTYNYEIIDYLNNREDISYQDMKAILEELGFTVDEDGTIYWD